ncbi:MAG: dihydroneopterin aldolase [Elusimicrobiota bacterium]
MPDMLWLNGIECRARVGVPARERAHRQKILVDVGMEIDARKAAERDDIRLSVDYSTVERTVRSEAETGERVLIETLAERLAAAVLRGQGGVRAVNVRVRKTPAVMPRTREVCVAIYRTCDSVGGAER